MTMKSYIIFIGLLNMAFNVFGQLSINSNKIVAQQLDLFEATLKNEWNDAGYATETDFSKVCDEIVKEYKRFSNEAITLTSLDGTEFYYKFILGQQKLARRYGVWEVEIYFQDFMVKLVTKYDTREEREKEKVELYRILGDAIDAIDTETNDRIATIYSGYKVKHFRMLPAKTDIFAKLHYGELSKGNLLFLNNSSLVFGSDLNAISSNIVSGYVGSFPVRF